MILNHLTAKDMTSCAISFSKIICKQYTHLEVQTVLEVHLVRVNLILQELQSHQDLQVVQIALMVLSVQVVLVDLVVRWDLNSHLAQSLPAGLWNPVHQEIRQSHSHQVLQKVLFDQMARMDLVVLADQQVPDILFLLEGPIALESLKSQETLMVQAVLTVLMSRVSQLDPLVQKVLENLLNHLVLEVHFHLENLAGQKIQGFHLAHLDLFVQEDLDSLMAPDFHWVQLGQ